VRAEGHDPSARDGGRRFGVAVVVGLLAAAPLLAACGDADPTVNTQIPPADDTQPVNSMTQDSAMVPGGELDPQPAPEMP
jgi:hypothetical protein